MFTPIQAPLAQEWVDILNDFAVYQNAANLAEKTIQNRAECVAMLARRSGESPTTVNHRHMMDMLARISPRSGQPVSAGTKQTERSYLQSFFSWLKDEEIRPDDPSKRLPKVKVPRRKPRPLRPAQIERMLDSGAYKRTRDMIMLAALSGMRIGEIVKIRGEHYDREARTLFSLRKGGIQDTISLHSTLVELADSFPRTGWWFPSPYPNKQFPNGDGHILMKSASDAISKAIRRAGITDVRLTGHSLRHYLASQLLAEGAPLRVVQEILGHSSLATTQLYMEVTDEQKETSVNMLPPIEIRAQATRAHPIVTVPILNEKIAA